jgi:hypothetical protein
MEDYEGDFSRMGQKGVYADYGPSWAAASATPGSYYKTFSTEGGLRVPLIVRFPETVPAGARVAEFAYVLDVVPTILDLPMSICPAPSMTAARSMCRTGSP